MALLTLVPVRAQEPIRTDTLRADTLRTDTLGVDSLSASDTLASDTAKPAATRLRQRDIGAPLGSVTTLEEEPGYDFVTKRDLIWERYFTAYDIFLTRLPAYPLSMGAPGLARTFSYAGASPDAIATLYNGRTLRGPGDAAFDPELYPMEFVERVEILRGATAALYGSGESLIALNFVEPRYDVEGSYTRLWYSQGPNNTTTADITYARNIGAKANLALGFRRLASDGIYRNQRVSGWSGRGAMRWELSDNLVISLTELFSDATRGVNGGLADSSSRLPLFAEVRNDTLSERKLRHDITLAARWYPVSVSVPVDDTTGLAPVDTTFRIDGALYITYANRELQVSDRPAILPGASVTETIGGARVGLRLPLAFARLLANGLIEYGAYENGGDLRLEAGGLLEIPAGDIVMARGGAKFGVVGENASLTVMGEGVITIGETIALRGTIRNTTALQSVECPLVLPPPGFDTLRSLGIDRTSLLAEGVLELRNGPLHIEAGGFMRSTTPFDCSGFESYTLFGGSLTVAIPIAFLTLKTHLLATAPPKEYTGFPFIYGVSDLYGEWELFGGNLDLRLGTALEYQTSTTNIIYESTSGSFFIPKADRRSTVPPFPNWSAYAQGRIGTAFLRVEMRNILDSEFAKLDRYPTFGRALYLGVNWALVD